MYQPQPQGNYPAQPGYPQGPPAGSNYPLSPNNGSGNPYPNPGTVPSAPPASLFDSVAGYEKTTYGQGYLPPPPVAPSMPEQQRPDEQFVGAAAITAEEARDAMLDFVSSQCCYGSDPAKQMVIHDINPSSAYHYKLSTFTESRSTSWQVDPYTGQIIDGPHNGLAPGPWNINVQPSKMFSPSSTRVEVPHTASVKQCHDCCGGGYKQCSKCLGRGWGTCSTCQGSGFINEFNEEKQCTTCRGSGESRCIKCNGDGRVQCTTCKSHGKLKTFIQLTVTWKTHDKDYVVERSQGGPKEKVAAANGIQIFNQELPRGSAEPCSSNADSHVPAETNSLKDDHPNINSNLLYPVSKVAGPDFNNKEIALSGSLNRCCQMKTVWPITTFFDKDINVASQRIVTEHANTWPQERILMQRQILRAVPVAEVAYGWKEENLRFWVYGNEPRQVFAPDYPQQCCCGCVIL